ncbi:hypothetical protein GEMRC1_003480 [Eukaryota sp. GEM-RC1]
MSTDFTVKIDALISSAQSNAINHLVTLTQQSIRKDIMQISLPWVKNIYNTQWNSCNPWSSLIESSMAVVSRSIEQVEAEVKEMQISIADERSRVKELLYGVAAEQILEYLKIATSTEKLQVYSKKFVSNTFSSDEKISLWESLNFFKNSSQFDPDQKLGQVAIQINDFLTNLQVLSLSQFSESPILKNLVRLTGSSSDFKIFEDDVIKSVLDELEPDFKMASSVYGNKVKQFRRTLFTVGILLFVVLFMGLNKPKLLVFLLVFIILFQMWFSQSGLTFPLLRILGNLRG